eukprot:TRINITY_DN56509_c0_g1_i1.p1 TRINITY_DN56509_c0_g1~~TRINITY_DN56509_c0_g1_i1.p1  ORF type:complete len:212 (+),score=33.82 TRINITY_DN56509_c0_g1_i1:101-736(+)
MLRCGCSRRPRIADNWLAVASCGISNIGNCVSNDAAEKQARCVSPRIDPKGTGSPSACPLPYPARYHACVTAAEAIMPPEEDIVAASLSGGKGSCAPLTSPEKRLLLYALRNQVEQGPCTGSRPWPWETVPYAKWSAWSSLGNMNKFEAMRIYCRAIEDEVPYWWKPEEMSGAIDNGQFSEEIVEVSTVTEVSEGEVKAKMCWGLCGICGL